MFQGKLGVPPVVLEAIADNCCRQIWHFNFGSPGALNDLNILDRSPCLTMPFVVNLLLLILLPMGMHISMYIGLVAESILAMLALLKRLQNPNFGCKKCLHWHRRERRRTLNERLECSRHESIS